MNWEEKLVALAKLGIVDVHCGRGDHWSAVIQGSRDYAVVCLRAYAACPSLAIDDLWREVAWQDIALIEQENGRIVERGRYRLHYDGTAWVRRPVEVGA